MLVVLWVTFLISCWTLQIRVSEKMSNGPIILNVDCDMYSSSSQTVKDALCFFMDEEKGNEIAYVQFPQNYENVTKNDVYASYMRTISEVRIDMYMFKTILQKISLKPFCLRLLY